MTKTKENAGKTPSKVGGGNFKRLYHAVNVSDSLLSDKVLKGLQPVRVTTICRCF